MKRNMSPDGYRNKILQVRLTEAEDTAFQTLYEKAKINNDGLLVSDFIRQQLLYESNDKRLKEIFNEVRKMRTEFHQAVLALRQFEDESSSKYLTELVSATENKIDSLKKEMEIFNSGNNDIKESERG